MKAAETDGLRLVSNEKGPRNPRAQRVPLENSLDTLPRDFNFRVRRVARVPRDGWIRVDLEQGVGVPSLERNEAQPLGAQRRQSREQLVNLTPCSHEGP